MSYQEGDSLRGVLNTFLLFTTSSLVTVVSFEGESRHHNFLNCCITLLLIASNCICSLVGVDA